VFEERAGDVNIEPERSAKAAGVTRRLLHACAFLVTHTHTHTQTHTHTGLKSLTGHRDTLTHSHSLTHTQDSTL